MLKTERADIATLVSDPTNPRRHNERNLEAIKASLLKFGLQKPLVIDAKGVVVAGNGTLEAARQLGWEKIDVVRSDLTGVEVAAYAIADNRTAELAEWDFEALAPQLQALKDDDFDMGALGWAEHELEPLLAADWTPPAIAELPGADGKTGVKPIALTDEQREVIERAVARVRSAEGDKSLSEGRCVELVCTEYLRTE